MAVIMCRAVKIIEAEEAAGRGDLKIIPSTSPTLSTSHFTTKRNPVATVVTQENLATAAKTHLQRSFLTTAAVALAIALATVA